MSKVIIRTIIGVALLASWAVAAVGGFVWGHSYASARESSLSAFIEASALNHIRSGDLDEGAGILETRIDMNVNSHLHTVWAEEMLPEIWILKRTSHRGLGFVSTYRTENPRNERADDLTESILSCYRAPDLPDPDSAAYRKAILECYDQVR
jgi:hypothetical protein